MTTTKAPIIMKFWDELTEQEKQGFIKMMKHVGYPENLGYRRNAYQIKDGKLHGFIEGYAGILLKIRSKK